MEPDADCQAFWSSRRRQYNIALVITGVLAGAAFFAVLVAWEIWPPSTAEDFFRYADFEMLSLLFAPVAYAIAMGIANIFYELGPLAEIVVRPRKPGPFRRWLYVLGVVFSVLLPWVVPVNAWYEFFSVHLRR